MGAAEDVSGVGVAGAMRPDQLAMLLETNGSAFIRLDRDWRFSYVNRQAELLLRRGRDELIGRGIWDVYPLAVDSPWRMRYQQAVDTGEEVAFEADLAPIGAWFEVRATPDELGLSVFFLDVSARRRAYDRLSLVAEITRVLVGNRDVDSVAATLAGAVVPDLATWAIVSLYDDEGRLYEAAAAHRDPERADDVARLEALHPQLLRDVAIVASAADSGRPEVRHGLAGHIRAGAAAGRELFQVLDRLGCDSVMILPLRARERALGVLALFQGEGGPDLEAELETAVGLADRAGLALENAQLYARQRQVAEVLQRSLLTPLPQPEHLSLVARYLPAAESSEVGGDWYDAFVQPNGDTVLVIGDIVGHDIAAAAAMGQLRNLLRGTAYDRADGPAQLVERLDALVTGLAIGSLATLLVARLEQLPGRDTRRLRWSNAGHPPPMVRRKDGTVEVLEHEADPPLGLEQAAERHEHAVELHPGDTLLLYTDGLVERRDQSLTTGIATLAQAWGELAPCRLDEACDAMLARMLPDRPFDDVALLTVRLNA